MVLFTLGTGVGGGLIMDDAIIEGRHSHAGEVGHIRIELTHPRACPCGRMGCLEAYASAPAVVKRTQEALSATDAESVLRGRDAISARDVFDAASDHDPLAVKMVEETAYYLAIGAVNLMHTLDPDMIVFGGGMIASGMPFLERIRRHVRELAFPVPAERTKIEFAQLGASAGFIGAAGCSRALFRRCSK
jgi:glucokinase